MIVSIIGPSGCGKGTQAKLLAEKFGIPAISMGQLFRDAYAARTAEGLAAEKYWGRGNWAPADLAFKVLVPRLEKADCQNGFVIDGLPRKMDDIGLFETYLDQRGWRLERVIHLDTSEATCVARIMKRVETTQRRGGEARCDETPAAVRKRLEEYRETIAPVLEYFEKKGILERIDNERSVQEVFEDIVSRLPHLQKPSS